MALYHTFPYHLDWFPSMFKSHLKHASLLICNLRILPRPYSIPPIIPPNTNAFCLQAVVVLYYSDGEQTERPLSHLLLFLVHLHTAHPQACCSPHHPGLLSPLHTDWKTPAHTHTHAHVSTHTHTQTHTHTHTICG